MFGPLGFWEVIFIMGLALLIFGPKKLPEIGRMMGRGMGEFRRATTDLKRTIEQEVEEAERTPPRASLSPPPPAKPTSTSDTEASSTPESSPASKAAPAAESSPSASSS